jgi:DNA damage-inducible protein 1
MTLADFKTTVQHETTFPAAQQTIFHNGQTLRDDSKTLEAVGLKDGEMLAILITSNRQPRAAAAQAPRAQGRAQAGEPDDTRIEQIRQQIMANPEHMNSLISENPELARVIENPVEFRRLWQEMQSAQRRNAQERREQAQALNDDMFSPEAQMEIERRIRQQQIEANIQYALEHNPAGKYSAGFMPI